MSATRWYDRVAPVYDLASAGDRFYRRARKDAIELLRTSSGDTVLDVFCGTGVNLPLLAERLGGTGKIVGVDGSDAMLERSRSEAEKYVPSAIETTFEQIDLSQPQGVAALAATVSRHAPQAIVFTLGLTCVANWRDVVDAVWEAAAPQTRIGTLDVYSERLTLGARLINRIGAADCTRPVHEALLERAPDATQREHRPFKVIDVSVIVTAATKGAS